MPIYSYKCTKCGNRFERLEGVIIEEEELKCTKCGSRKVNREFSPFSVGKSSSKIDSSPSGPPPSCPGCPSGSCGFR
jgi:putative FmdB family regulatory protein